MGLDSAKTGRGYNVSGRYSGACLGRCVGMSGMKTGAAHKRFKKIEAIPEWFMYLRPDSLLSVKEMARLYGIRENTVHDRVSNGLLPPATVRLKPNGGGPHRCFWRRDDALRHFIAEIESELA